MCEKTKKEERKEKGYLYIYEFVCLCVCMCFVCVVATPTTTYMPNDGRDYQDSREVFTLTPGAQTCQVAIQQDTQQVLPSN